MAYSWRPPWRPAADLLNCVRSVRFVHGVAEYLPEPPAGKTCWRPKKSPTLPFSPDLSVTSSSSRSCWKLASAPRDCGELRRSKTNQEVEGRLVDAARTATARNLAAADDLATLNYTGGTTGKSKGALRYHRESSALANAILADFEFPETPSYLAVAPISHVAGTKVLPTLLRGGTVHMLKGFDPEALLKTIERERINFTLFVPTMIYVMLDHPALDKTDLSSLELVLYGPSRQLRAHSTITDARSADAHGYARAPSTTPPMAVTYRRCRSRI